jgi:hypothetical protein
MLEIIRTTNIRCFMKIFWIYYVSLIMIEFDHDSCSLAYIFAPLPMNENKQVHVVCC